MTFSSISDLWNKWNIRGSVILSLLFQVFLILFAPLRKKIANKHIIFLLWLAYLMADSIVVYGIGLISHNQSNLCAHAAEVDRSLQAFWASFLLLHLGGPDTITAFSLEDNSLWKRHLLNLIFQVGASIYLFAQIFPNDKSLVYPTTLVFYAGLLKNVERTLALSLSSLPTLRNSISESYGHGNRTCLDMVEELEVLGYGYSDEEEAKMSESVVVKHAYNFFNFFIVMLIDLFYKSEDRLISRKYFHKVSAADALRVISAELYFIYEVLHTKALIIRFRRSYILRFVAFIEVAMASVLFNRSKKHQLPKLDVEITYILLFGGIALDVIALFMFVFSDWTIARIMHSKTGSSKLDLYLHKLISATDDLRKPRFATYEAKYCTDAVYATLDTPFLFRRWSESIIAWNFFSAILRENPKTMYKRNWHWGMIAFAKICGFKIVFCFHQACKIITFRFRQACAIVAGRQSSDLAPILGYMSKNPFMNKLWIFIFMEVRRKSEDVNNSAEARKIFEARGDLFLLFFQGRPGGMDCGNLLEHITDIAYDTSVITWHIATEIWYNKEMPTERNDEREISKILSDYLLYLFTNQPTVMSAVAGFAQIELEGMVFEAGLWDIDARNVQGLCRTLYDNFLSRSPRDAPFRGIQLARQMACLGEKKWEVMSGVWVEMLSYAAVHIKGEGHAQVLSRGGELLALVWLLMAHFGCLYKPEWGAFEEFVFGQQSETSSAGDDRDQEGDGGTV